MAQVKADLTELNNLIKMLKKDYTVRIGIIDDEAKKQHDEKSGITNAELGTFHEFGSASGDRPPRRSFLEDSLKYKLNFNNPDMKPFKKIIWKQFFIKHAPEEFYKDILKKGLSAVINGFLTGGYGMWKPISQSTRAAWERRIGIRGWQKARSIATFRKGLNKSLDREPLLDTQRLMKSIDGKIIRNK